MNLVCVPSQTGMNRTAAVDVSVHDVPAQSGASMADAIVVDVSVVGGAHRDIVPQFSSAIAAGWSGDLSVEASGTSTAIMKANLI